MRDAIVNDRPLSMSEVARFTQRQRDRVYRLRCIVRTTGRQRRVTTLHKIGASPSVCAG